MSALVCLISDPVPCGTVQDKDGMHETGEQMSAGGSNRLLRYAEAAGYLNMSESTLRQNWRRWGLQAHRIGRSVQFRERELERWIESKAEKAA